MNINSLEKLLLVDLLKNTFKSTCCALKCCNIPRFRTLRYFVSIKLQTSKINGYAFTRSKPFVTFFQTFNYDCLSFEGDNLIYY